MTNGNSQEEEMTASRGTDYNTYACFPQEKPTLHMAFYGEVLDLCNVRSGFRENTYFLTSVAH